MKIPALPQLVFLTIACLSPVLGQTTVADAYHPNCLPDSVWDWSEGQTRKLNVTEKPYFDVILAKQGMFLSSGPVSSPATDDLFIERLRCRLSLAGNVHLTTQDID